MSKIFTNNFSIIRNHRLKPSHRYSGWWPWQHVKKLSKSVCITLLITLSEVHICIRVYCVGAIVSTHIQLWLGTYEIRVWICELITRVHQCIGRNIHFFHSQILWGFILESLNLFKQTAKVTKNKLLHSHICPIQISEFVFIVSTKPVVQRSGY